MYNISSKAKEDGETFPRCLAAPDFKEGIRCNLIDKDKGLKPLWNPATLKQVKMVESNTRINCILIIQY